MTIDDADERARRWVGRLLDAFDIPEEIRPALERAAAARRELERAERELFLDRLRDEAAMSVEMSSVLGVPVTVTIDDTPIEVTAAIVDLQIQTERKS